MGRRLRYGSVLVVGAVALVASACAPPTTGTPTTTTTTTTTTSTTTTIPLLQIPEFSYQLPSFSLGLPPVGINFGCSATYNPPSFSVAGPTLLIPATTVQVVGSSVPLPGIQLDGFTTTVSLGSFTISCPVPFLPPLTYTSGVAAVVTVGSQTVGGTINLLDETITVPAVTIQVSGSLVFQGFGGLSIGFPTQSITLPGVTLPIPDAG